VETFIFSRRPWPGIRLCVRAHIGGVRIGTAEIHRVVATMEEIADSVFVGQQFEGDERLVLSVKMKPGFVRSEELMKKIRSIIRSQWRPRHVPAVILETPDVPYAINGKKVEVAVQKLIHGQEMKSRDALRNPECLEFYRTRGKIPMLNLNPYAVKLLFEPRFAPVHHRNMVHLFAECQPVDDLVSQFVGQFFHAVVIDLVEPIPVRMVFLELFRVFKLGCPFSVAPFLFKVLFMDFYLHLIHQLGDIEIDHPDVLVMHCFKRFQKTLELFFMDSPAAGEVKKVVFQFRVFCFQRDLAKSLPVLYRQVVHAFRQAFEFRHKAVVCLLVLFIVLADPEFLILDPCAAGCRAPLPVLCFFYFI